MKIIPIFTISGHMSLFEVNSLLKLHSIHYPIFVTVKMTEMSLQNCHFGFGFGHSYRLFQTASKTCLYVKVVL